MKCAVSHMIIEDQGIIISVQQFQERHLLVRCFLRKNGLMAGLLANTKANKADHMPGNIVESKWSGRTQEQLGYFKLDLLHNTVVTAIFDKITLSILNSTLSLLRLILHEKEPHIAFFDHVVIFLQHIGKYQNNILFSHYLNFELKVLEASGFGLDLNKCVVTGNSTDLVYISPKSGAAVSQNAGQPYHDKLLPLPTHMLCIPETMGSHELLSCLQITGFFIEKHILSSVNKKMPPERGGLCEALEFNTVIL